MSVLRMDHVGIVVGDLQEAIAFFTEIGMEMEGKAQIEGGFAERVSALEGVRCDIAMMRSPDGSDGLELTQYHYPQAILPEPANAPANTMGLRNVMFNVSDIDNTVARLVGQGGELIGEIAQYEESHRLCYVRGPEGIIVALAETLR